ncbi:MAG: hypothetical protein R3F34_00640 [Planctomycetota bacterium]
MSARDACDVVQHLLGDAGLKLLVDAFVDEGAPAEIAQGVLRAANDFDAMAERHAGSRPGLELLLASMLPGRVDPARLESSQRLAFLGNSAVWGVQSRVRLVTHVVAPCSDDAERVEIAILSGHYGFKRLRPVTGWKLNTSTAWGGDARPPSEPLDPSATDEDPPLVRAFSSPDLPEMSMHTDGERSVVELGEGPVGNTAAFDAVFGWCVRGFAPVYGDEGDVAEHSSWCDTPAELLHFDVLIHRSLPFTEAPRLACVGLAQGLPTPPHSLATSSHLPVTSRVQSIGAPPALSTPDVPRYGELVAYACTRFGHDVGDFKGYRVVMRYPPVPAMPVLYYPLPRR